MQDEIREPLNLKTQTGSSFLFSPSLLRNAAHTKWPGGRSVSLLPRCRLRGDIYQNCPAIYRLIIILWLVINADRPRELLIGGRSSRILYIADAIRRPVLIYTSLVASWSCIIYIPVELLDFILHHARYSTLYICNMHQGAERRAVDATGLGLRAPRFACANKAAIISNWSF